MTADHKRIRRRKYYPGENAARSKRRADRRARGICLDCPAPSPGRPRCEACRLRLKAANIAYLDRKESRHAA